jgi:hypothetical protein
MEQRSQAGCDVRDDHTDRLAQVDQWHSVNSQRPNLEFLDKSSGSVLASQQEEINLLGTLRLNNALYSLD